jgi:hypothetical protein
VRAPDNRSWTLVDSLLLTVALYAFAGWVYIAIVAFTQPQTLGMRLTHFSNEPHEDTFGELCFLISFCATSARHVLRRLSPR